MKTSIEGVFCRFTGKRKENYTIDDKEVWNENKQRGNEIGIASLHAGHTLFMREVVSLLLSFFLKVLLETNLIIMCIFPNLTLPISVMGNCFMEPDPAINVFEGSECRKIKINFAQKVLITVIFSYSLHCLRSCFHCDFYQFPSLIISFCIGNDLRYRLIQ